MVMEQEVIYETKQDKREVELVLRVNPMGSVRTTRKGKYTDRARRYHEWMSKVQWLYRKALLDLGMSVKVLPDGVVDYYEFGIEVGKTTGKRVGSPHTMKPDWDNLCKGVQDAIFYKAEVDDCEIHTVGGVKKVWVAKGEGYIKIRFSV